MKEETEEIECIRCGAKFAGHIISLFGETVLRQHTCPDCVQQYLAAERSRELTDRSHNLTDAWQRFAPRRYWHCDVDRLSVRPADVSRILNWRPNKDGRGLGLVGPPRIGKRRLLFLLAKDLFFTAEKIRLAQTSTVEFGRLTSWAQFTDELQSQAIERIEEIRTTQVLILTDLGTEKLTEHAQVELYSLIEFRAQNLLPILWTTQFSAEQLAAKFSSSRQEVDVARARGRAAIGRLNQCSDVILIENEFVRNTTTSEQQALSA